MTMDSDLSLELSGDRLRELVDEAMQRIAAHLDSLPDQPAWNSDGAAALARTVAEPMPEDGQPVAKILDYLFQELIPVTFNTASPGYLAFIPGGGVPHAAVADLISGAINRYVGVWIAAPGLAQIEATVVRWFCDIIGFPKEAGGFLTTGGSLANWSALVTARRCRLPDDFLSATIYTSNQAHHSVLRAATLAGFPEANVRLVEVDEQSRVCVNLLSDRITADRASGMTPFAIVGHAGTVNTGAVDDLDSLADLASHENLWLHVDAAYGGFFMLTDRGRRLLRGIERADSVTLDPHKGLFLPYGTGCLLTRDLEHLRRAHTIRADYMPALQEQAEFVDLCDISPELSRDFRGLRVWLPLKMHGVAPFRSNLDEKLDLAEWATQELRKISDEIDDELEIVAQPQLSILAFRLRREGLDEPALTKLNEEFLERINTTRRVYMTPTLLDDRYVIRICVLCFRTHLDRMQECMNEVRRALAELESC